MIGSIRKGSILKLIRWILLSVYVPLFIYIVFFARRRRQITWEADSIHWIPLKNTIQSFYALDNHSFFKRIWFFFTNFFGNILLFVPIPLLLVAIFRTSDTRVILSIGALASILIEGIQYYYRIGIPDIDDILLNMAGVCVGILLLKTNIKR